MNFRHIKGVLLQEWYVTIRSMEVIMDIFFFPFINIVVFGFLSMYLVGERNAAAGHFVLLGMLLWQIIWVVQYSVALGSMWNIWSHNLSNMFVAPLGLSEYIFAQTVSGMIKALFILGLGTAMSTVFFSFNLLTMGVLPFLLVFINFSLFAFSLGIAVLGLIFCYGTRIQALAWSLVIIFQPLSAAFYPLSVMPQFLQYTAYLFPSTFTFEAARYALTTGGAVAWGQFGTAFAENMVYAVLAILLFFYLYNKSRDTGQFARNEA